MAWTVPIKGPPIGNDLRESNGHVIDDVTWPRMSNYPIRL